MNRSDESGAKMSDELEVLKDVARRLDGAGIAYMLSGSVAMNFYAQPRMTRDIDVLLLLDEGHVRRFVDVFKDDYYVEESTVSEEVKRRGMFNLIHNDSIIKVDFMLQQDGDYDRVAFERKRTIDLEGTPICMISPEDLVVRKLFWAKDSLSEMQLGDVRNIMESVQDLDLNYIKRWVGELGLDWLLAQLASGGER